MEFTVSKNQKIARHVYKMELFEDTAGIRPGQFVEIALPGRFLRRPISVCDFAPGCLTLI